MTTEDREIAAWYERQHLSNAALERLRAVEARPRGTRPFGAALALLALAAAAGAVALNGWEVGRGTPDQALPSTRVPRGECHEMKLLTGRESRVLFVDDDGHPCEPPAGDEGRR